MGGLQWLDGQVDVHNGGKDLVFVVKPNDSRVNSMRIVIEKGGIADVNVHIFQGSGVLHIYGLQDGQWPRIRLAG